MGSILEKIEQALKDMLIGWIESNLTNMFTDVNEKLGKHRPAGTAACTR